MLEIDRGTNRLSDKFPNYLRVMQSPDFLTNDGSLFEDEFKKLRLLIVTMTDRIIDSGQEAIQHSPIVYFTTFDNYTQVTSSLIQSGA